MNCFKDFIFFVVGNIGLFYSSIWTYCQNWLFLIWSDINGMVLLRGFKRIHKEKNLKNYLSFKGYFKIHDKYTNNNIMKNNVFFLAYEQHFFYTIISMAIFHTDPCRSGSKLLLTGAGILIPPLVTATCIWLWTPLIIWCVMPPPTLSPLCSMPPSFILPPLLPLKLSPLRPWWWWRPSFTPPKPPRISPPDPPPLAADKWL